MGLGYWLSEAIVYDKTNGELLTNRTWNYKVPGAKDIPIDFRIKFLKNSANEAFVLRSKGKLLFLADCINCSFVKRCFILYHLKISATGEPSLCMSIVVTFALRHAIDSARRDAGIEEKWFEMSYPLTPEVICLNSGHSPQDFKLTSD